MSRLRAAFRKVNITPEETVPLQGYDPNTHIADPRYAVLDDLFARVAVLDDGAGRRHVVVGVDCCLVNEAPFQASDPGGNPLLYRHFLGTLPPGTREEWGSAAGADRTAVTVHATHTHCAPEHIGATYTSRVTAAIADATRSLTAVQVRAAVGETALAVNRRPHLRHNEALAVNRQLAVVAFEDMRGKPLGALVNGAFHPTLLLPANRISAEYVGLAMSRWEETADAGFVALFVQGFSGDVGPYGHYRNEPVADTYPWVKRRGKELYDEAAALYARAAPVPALPLRSLERTVWLPTKAGYFRPYVESSLQGLRIGDVAVLSTSSETFSGYADLLGPSSPFAVNLWGGVSNGYTGYLPTPGAFADGLGGYEMNTTPYTPAACDAFLSEARHMLRFLSLNG